MGGLLRYLFVALVIYVVVRIFRQALPAPRPPAGRRSRKPTMEPEEPLGAAPPKDPYATLGLTEGASWSEVRAAYQQRMRENHPDRVADMSAEIRALAEQRSKEINAAYAELKERLS